MSENKAQPWQDRILGLWADTINRLEIDEKDLSPSQDWASNAWDQLDVMLQNAYGINANDKSREYRIGCAVGMMGRIAEDCGKLLKIEDEKIAGVPEFLESVRYARNLVKELQGGYVEALKIAAEAMPSESASFTEGLCVAQKTVFQNCRGLPAYGNERGSLYFLLGIVGLAKDAFGISDSKINTAEFQKLVDLTEGTNSGSEERVKKFLSDMKAPRLRGRPKRQE